jgi:hypothetical protein
MTLIVYMVVLVLILCRELGVGYSLEASK